jgi:DNA-binding NarL/FixJ family response regulator
VSGKRSRPTSYDGVLKPPRGFRASRFKAGSEELAVLSFPLPAIPLPASLSPAERDVAIAIVAGKTNEEIAAERRSSVRTVANQVASMFRKLQVRSRGELVAVLCTTKRGRARRGRPRVDGE